jgi:ATP-dependent helicase/nuclease subunit A
MAHSLNREQLEATSWFDSDLLVTAGAGTGKTSVLTGKFLRLLEERRAGVTEIVAITFTKKAAAEMQDRIRQGIVDHLAGAAEVEEREFWKSQLLKLERARICTFHSFCLGLIKEHPLEAGVPPVSGILGEGEETIYLNQSIETALTEAFAIAGDNRQVLTRILFEMGWDPFLANLGRVYQAIRESGNTSEAVIRLSIETITKSNPPTPYQMAHLVELIEDLLTYSRTVELTGHAGEIISSLLENWPGYRDSLTGGGTAELLAAMNQLKKALPKTLPAAIKDRVVEIRDLLEGLTTQSLDREYLLRLPVFGDLLARVDRCYAALKQESGLLDFTDQQLLARDLLRGYPDLAAEVRQGIRYLLVDEFQDTNSLQMELVNLLTGDDYRDGRLMVVGDVKQSIYRFRGAEADLLRTLAQQFREKQGKLISLTQNYRSNHMIIKFVNQISGEIFKNEAFTYESLEAAVPDQGSNIEFILTGEADRTVEAGMIAARIFQLVRESEAAELPVRYGDIVLLFRSGTDMALYQQALQKLGIPYFTASGRGFYRCQEVMDQLNLLRLVQQRYDGIALLGVLTSPYAGLTDEGLLWLGEGQNLITGFYESETFSESIPVSIRERLYRFRELLVDLQQNRENLKIPAILRTALEQCNYREILWTFPNPGQRIANLEKLIAKADEFVAKGFYDLHRFLAYIEKLEEVEVLEGEAQTEAEAGDAVRLMTIHRAKGLEFPVVFLPDLDRQFPRGSQTKLVYHKAAGLGFTIPVDEGETGAPTNWEIIKELGKQEELSEYKRVLYVALTRAKRQLILAGSGVNRSKGKTLEAAGNWMKWFELLLPLGQASSTLDYQGIPIRITREIPAVAGPVPLPSLLDRYLSQLPGGFFSATSGGGSEREVAATAIIAKGLKSFKVTELLVFRNCPRRYFWQYCLRLTETAPDLAAQSQERTTGGRHHLGSRIGIFIHQATRLANSTWPEELWLQNFGDLTPGESGRLKPDLVRIWNNFRQSRYTEASGECWDETPFLVKMAPEVSIEGRFDRLIRGQNGELILVDYKTHRVPAGEANLLATGYYWQLQLYALAVETLWGRLPDQAVLYFLYPNLPVPVPMERERLNRTMDEVKKIAGFVNQHHQLQDYPMKSGCQSCGYSLYCNSQG